MRTDPGVKQRTRMQVARRREERYQVVVRREEPSGPARRSSVEGAGGGGEGVRGRATSWARTAAAAGALSDIRT